MNFLEETLRAKGNVPGFAGCFPILHWIIMRPQLTLLTVLLLGCIFVMQSNVLALAPLCLWTALIAFYLERRLLDRLLFPPFTAVACWNALGTGIGIPIMAWQIQNSSRMGAFGVVDWAPSFLTIQCVFLASFPIAWIGYYLGGFRKVCPLNLFSIEDGINKKTGKQLIIAGWVFFLLAVFLLTLTVIFNVDSRAPSNAKEQISRIFIFIKLFSAISPKWSVLGFIFVPLLWGRGNVFCKVVIFSLLIIYLVIALTTGSRGGLLYPASFVIAGHYFFRTFNSKKIESMLFAIIPLAIFLIFAIYVSRNSQEFRSVQNLSITDKCNVLRKNLLKFDESQVKPWALFDLGYAFFGFEDAKVFAMTPLPVTHAGFDGFEAIPLTWIPTTLYKNKPRLLDAESIVETYNLQPMNVTGLGISLQADAYRRFGWFGVPFVVIVAYALYGALVRWLFSFWNKRTLWAVFLVCFSMTFFWSRPFGTVLGTWWAFFYDMPKQLLVNAILCFLIIKLAEGVSALTWFPISKKTSL